MGWVADHRLRAIRELVTECVQRTYLLVDGHNIMHAWPELRRTMVSASKRNLARVELMQRLRNYQDMTGVQVVLVFDGTQSQISEEREKDGLQVIYADAKSTADTIIERLTAKYASQHQLRVASADGMIRETILALGAEWVSPELLSQFCDNAERTMRDRINRR